MAVNLMSAEQLNKAWIDLQEEYREAMRIYDIHAAENAVRQKMEIEKAKARVSAEATYPQWFGGPLTIPLDFTSFHWLGKDAKPQEQKVQKLTIKSRTHEADVAGTIACGVKGDPDGPQFVPMSGKPGTAPSATTEPREHSSLGRALSRMNRGFMPRYGEHYDPPTR